MCPRGRTGEPLHELDIALVVHTVTDVMVTVFWPPRPSPCHVCGDLTLPVSRNVAVHLDIPFALIPAFLTSAGAVTLPPPSCLRNPCLVRSRLQILVLALCALFLACMSLIRTSGGFILMRLLLGTPLGIFVVVQ
jgi:hypothetical protein